MKKYQIGALFSAILAVVILYAGSRLSSEFWSSTQVEEASQDESEPITPQPHLATDRMIEGSNKASGTSAPDFLARGDDGKLYRLSEIVAHRPAVLVFIKDGCPCSRSADQFFRRIHAAGRGWVPFFGVIDGGVMVADRWAEQTQTVFPVLADPDLSIIHKYGAESSAYVAFISPGGKIEKLWAGYSEPMLKELAARMAPWVKPGMEPFDVSDAPAELYAGCPY